MESISFKVALAPQSCYQFIADSYTVRVKKKNVVKKKT